MSIISDSVLIESKSARDNQLTSVSHDHATSILAKVKALYFALWQGTDTATTEQMKEFYEVSVEAVQKVIQRHRHELESDGLKTLKGKELKSLRALGMDSLSITEATTIITVWTPRAALRLGMLLRDSPIAQAVRSSLLDAVEHVIPAQFDRLKELELQNQQLVLQLELAKTQERLIATTQALATLHGSGMVALILGKPDAIIERITEVEKTVLCNERGQPLKTFRGLSKTKLAKRYGLKKPQDFVAWLHSLGKTELLQNGLTTTPCEFVSWESIEELDRAFCQRQGTRQRLLGE